MQVLGTRRSTVTVVLPQFTGRTKLGITVLFRQVYTRDALGRITEKQELVDGVTTTWGYGYDSGGRLTSVTRNGSSYASYGYDFNGNRTSVTRSGVTKTASYDAHDRLISDGETGYSFSYDYSGMLKSRTKGSVPETFAYDEFGVLTSTSIGGVSYVVDGANRRVGKRKGTGVVQGFLYQDQLRPAAELGASNVIVNRFVYADRANIPSYFVRSSKLYRVIADHLGSPRVVVDAATGAVVQRLDFDEFGRVLKDTSPGFQPFGFAGGIYDQDTKLVRFGARDYDPVIGRWTSKDPIGFAGGDTNLYGYVLQDPVNLLDANGKNPLLAVAAAGWLAFEIGSSLYDLYGMAEVDQNKCASVSDKVWAGGAFAAGIILPGPGGAYVKGTTVLLDPSTVRFSQNSVKRVFQDGRTIDDLITALRTDPTQAAHVPPIRVFQHDGEIFSLDNRRLLAFSTAGIPIRAVFVTPSAREFGKKMSYGLIPTDGRFVIVR